jgi:hypothetical protein
MFLLLMRAVIPNTGPSFDGYRRKKLRITIPNKSLIGFQRSSYDVIEIVIKYEP